MTLVMYVCDGCGATIQPDHPDTRNWDWFKGYLPETLRYCLNCKNGEKRNKAFARRLKPVPEVKP